jgi:hypothetical protein
VHRRRFVNVRRVEGEWMPETVETTELLEDVR